MNDLPPDETSLETFSRGFLRCSLIVVLLWVGSLKFTEYEAKNIEGLLANSPFFAWALKAFGLRTLSMIMGVLEIGTGILLACHKFSPRAAVAGGIGAVITFVLTLSFVFTTPGVWEPGYGFPAPSVLPGQFLAKDLVLLAVSAWLLAESLRAVRRE